MARHHNPRRNVRQLSDPRPDKRDTPNPQLGRSGAGCLRLLTPIPVVAALVAVRVLRGAR